MPSTFKLFKLVNAAGMQTTIDASFLSGRLLENSIEQAFF